EFPVGRLLGLRVVHRPQADQVVAGVAAHPVGRLLLPVGQRVRFGVVGLVDKQVDVAVDRVSYVDVVALVRDMPAIGHADRETGGIREAVVPGGQGTVPGGIAATARGRRT